MSSISCSCGEEGLDAPEPSFVWDSVVEKIEDAETIVICGHVNPDGDAIGSTLALGQSVRRRDPQKAISGRLPTEAPVPRVYRFLPGATDMTPASSYPLNPDLFISVDVPTIERLGDAAAIAMRSEYVVTIDHHPARSEFADVVVRRPEAAACAVIIDDFLIFAGYPVDPDVANCLLTGLVTDTGRFQYQNANCEAFTCASRLVHAGADPALVALRVYQSQRLEYLHLESVVMGRIEAAAEGRITYSYALASDLAKHGVSPDECDGLVDVVRSIDGSIVCLFLREVGEGEIRGNLRSKCSLDVSQIAARHDGGGHAAAAGFTFYGTVEEALDALLPELIELVHTLDA